MQDRPTAGELLAAVEHFLDAEIVPNVGGSRAFHARVAGNAIRIVRRELEREDEALAREWDGLDALLSASERPAVRRELRDALVARNEALCARIRAGETDDEPFHDAVVSHVRETLREKLLVSNPRWVDSGSDNG